MWHRDARDEAGRRRIVRNGYLPPHTIQTGIGDVPVKATRVRDRAGEIRFTSSIPPLYLRLTKTRPNQVWAADITYIPMTRDFVYLCAVLDWASRRVLAWRLANTLTTDFCLEAIREAVTRYGTPDIFNTDQGSQFTAWSLPGSSRSTA